MRQVRGAVTAELRARSPRTLRGIASATGHSVERVAEAVTGLHGDGLVAATKAALAGRGGGRVSFPDEPATDHVRSVPDGSAASG